MPPITKRFVDAAAPDPHYDDKLPGFGLYVGASGARSYFLEYRPGRGRGVHKRRITIGKHGAPWTPQAARDRAVEFLTGVRGGRDPLAEREASKRGPDPGRLVSTVVDEWLRRDQAGIDRGTRSNVSSGVRCCRLGAREASKISGSETSSP